RSSGSGPLAFGNASLGIFGRGPEVDSSKADWLEDSRAARLAALELVSKIRISTVFSTMGSFRLVARSGGRARSLPEPGPVRERLSHSDARAPARACPVLFQTRIPRTKCACSLPEIARGCPGRPPALTAV